VLGSLAPLADRVLDQAHADELTRDVDAGLIRLEIFIDDRQLEPLGRRAVHELDGVDRAGLRARAVPNAAQWIDKLRAAVHERDHL
jgi:hypothetical protein